MMIMSIKALRYLTVSLLAAGVSACATNPMFEEPGDATFGEANRQTMMAQVVDPDPQYEDLIPISSGEHASDAVERYRTGKVIEPKRQQTTDAGSGPN
jgi:hypothetical protein